MNCTWEKNTKDKSKHVAHNWEVKGRFASIFLITSETKVNKREIGIPDTYPLKSFGQRNEINSKISNNPPHKYISIFQVRGRNAGFCSSILMSCTSINTVRGVEGKLLFRASIIACPDFLTSWNCLNFQVHLVASKNNTRRQLKFVDGKCAIRGFNYLLQDGIH